MIQRVLITLALIALILTACANIESDESATRPAAPTSTMAGNEPSVDEGMLDMPLNPIKGEENLARGEAFVNTAQLLILESDPLQIKLGVEGSLPTPCHQLRATVEKPDEQGRIQIELYSLVDPEVICIQVLQSFETEISLGSYPEGSYSVWLNGEQVGEFTE